jgi:hypothetical protein
VHDGQPTAHCRSKSTAPIHLFSGNEAAGNGKFMSPYQFIFACNTEPVNSRVNQQTLAEALEWLWHDYEPYKK